MKKPAGPIHVPQSSLLAVAACALLAFSPATRANPILWSTGTGAQGTEDTHYTVVNPYAGELSTPLIDYNSGGIGQLIGTSWVPNLPDGKWISPWDGVNTDPWANAAPNYTYVFQTIAAGSGTVNGTWASDNDGEIFVNGVATGDFSPGDGTYTPFTLTLTAGDIVDFDVYNAWGLPIGTGDGNPAGLLVAVPDGGLTAAILGGTMVCLHACRRRLSCGIRLRRMS